MIRGRMRLFKRDGKLRNEGERNRKRIEKVGERWRD